MFTPIKEEKPSKEQFIKFMTLRLNGQYDMLDPIVRDICRMTKAQHYYACEHYRELEEEYGNKSKQGKRF